MTPDNMLYKFQMFMSTRHNYIGVMPWEQAAAGAIGLSIDQLRFTLALFSSVLIGLGIRLFKSPAARHLYSLSTGFFLVYYPFGFGVIHALPPSALVYLALVLAPGSCGTASWLICFPYLIYLHVVNASGEAWQAGQMDFTGCEMVLVLKLISLAVARQDHYVATRKKRELSGYAADHAVSSSPSPLHFLSYVFGLGNLLAGPYVEYVDYDSFINLKGVWSPSAAKPMPSAALPSMWCMAQALGFMVAYQLLIPHWNRSVPFTPWFDNSSYAVKLGATFLMTLTLQLKFCFAWKVSETSLILAGLGFEGWSEDGKVPKWGRVENVRYLTGVLLCDSARLVPGNWNIGTGNFLRRYVYERLTPRGRKAGFPQLLATQLVSAIWHGLYPGYLMMFVASALWINSSTVIFKGEQVLLPAVLRDSLPWRGVKIAFQLLTLQYLATSFIMLDLHDSLRVWASLHYVPVIVLLLLCLAGPLIPGVKRSRSTGDTATKKEQ